MKKSIVLCLLAIFLVTGIATAQSNLGEIQQAAAGFSEDIAKALPFNSSLGLNWSDAYIGQFPHFGVGFAVGATTMKLASIQTLAGYFDTSIPLDIGGKMPVPAYTVEGRIGGFVLPFDIGLKAGFLPTTAIQSINLDYLMAGADVRYAVLDGVKNSSLPTVSIGAGVNYLKGGVGGSAGAAQTITFDYQGAHTLALTEPDVNLTWNTVALDLKAQVSKTFSIVTPYLGVGGSYAWTNSGYSVDSDITFDGNAVTQEDITTINGYLQQLGLEPVDVTVDGIASVLKESAFNARVYGGLSINIKAFRIDLTGLFNLLDQNYGASLGLRFQL